MKPAKIHSAYFDSRRNVAKILCNFRCIVMYPKFLLINCKSPSCVASKKDMGHKVHDVCIVGAAVGK